ncbi:hypothetical protein ACFOHY_01690 [Rhizobium rosettiformans]
MGVLLLWETCSCERATFRAITGIGQDRAERPKPRDRRKDGRWTPVSAKA